MIGKKSFECQHLGFNTSDVVEFVTTDEESFPAIFVLEEVTTGDHLGFEHLFLQCCKIDANRRAADLNKTIIQHASLFNCFDSKDARTSLNKVTGIFFCLE